MAITVLRTFSVSRLKAASWRSCAISLASPSLGTRSTYPEYPESGGWAETWGYLWGMVEKPEENAGLIWFNPEK